MSKTRKIRKRKIERKERRLNHELAKIEQANTDIPYNVSNMPQSASPYEDNNYLISFSNYNDECCGIQNLIKNNSRTVLKTIKKIGSNNNLYNLGLTIDPIIKRGDYKQLFNRIDPNDELEIKEITLSGTSRIFFYTIEPTHTFYIISIEQTHREKTKNKK